MRPTLPWVLLAIVLAGCAAPAPAAEVAPEPSALPDWAERALPNGDAHDHFDPAQHVGLSTPNFRVVGHDGLETDRMGAQAGGYFCGDLKARDGRALAVVHSFTSDVAFVLVDVTDPAKPTKVGELAMESTHVWDVAMTPDQRHVVLATSHMGAADGVPRPPTVTYRDACTGTRRALAGPESMAPWSAGVVLVDVTTPTDPRIADFHPLPAEGAHSIVAQDVGGDTRILATVVNQAPSTSYYAFFGLAPSPLGERLELHVLHAPGPTVAGTLYVNHDAAMQVHPVTGTKLAFLADGTAGVAILDIEDARAPRTLARTNEITRVANGPFDHYAHSVLPLDTTWDDRHYTFVSEECAGRPTETPSCLMYVLDTTDPTEPTLVSAWTLPVELGGWSYPGFSPHYMAIKDRTLFLAHWHAGLWAFDVSTPDKLRTLTPTGVFLPEQDHGYAPDGGAFDHYNMRPVVADVLVHGEHVVVFDGTTGVYVLTYDETRPAPVVEAWGLVV